jgi:N-acetylglutamate synthase-like GNAT family acetyltransferase
MKIMPLGWIDNVNIPYWSDDKLQRFQTRLSQLAEMFSDKAEASGVSKPLGLLPDNISILGEQMRLVPLTQDIYRSHLAEIAALESLITPQHPWTKEDVLKKADRRDLYDPSRSYVAISASGDLVALMLMGQSELHKMAYLSSLSVKPKFRGSVLARWLVYQGFQRSYLLGDQRARWISKGTINFYNEIGAKDVTPYPKKGINSMSLAQTHSNMAVNWKYDYEDLPKLRSLVEDQLKLSDQAQNMGHSIKDEDLSPELAAIAKNMSGSRKLLWQELWQYPDGTVEAINDGKVVWAAVKYDGRLAEEYKSNYLEVFRPSWTAEDWYQIKLGNVRLDDDHGYDPSGFEWSIDNNVLNFNNLYFKDKFQGEKMGANLQSWLLMHAARHGVQMYRNSNTFNPVALYLILKMFGSSDVHFIVEGKVFGREELLSGIGRMDVYDQNNERFASVNVSENEQGQQQFMLDDKVAVYQPELSSMKERVYWVDGKDRQRMIIKVIDQVIVRVFAENGAEYKVVYSKGVVAEGKLRSLQSSDGAVDAPGGIDLDPGKMDLKTRSSSGQGMAFNIDPQMLDKLKLADGLTPVIINIQPLSDLKQFMGVN